MCNKRIIIYINVELLVNVLKNNQFIIAFSVVHIAKAIAGIGGL